MRNWFIIGFGLVIVGCWLLTLGIRDRLEHSGSAQRDSTALALTETVEPAISLVSAAISRNSAEDTHQLINDEADDSSGHFEAQLLENSYHQMLISRLTEDGWDAMQLKILTKYLSDPRAEFLPEVLKKNATHVENWEQYSHHLTPAGFEMCREYWSKHHNAISSSAKTYNFPPAIILGILKVETNFGNYSGTRSVFNVFWSLSLGDNQQVSSENFPELNNMKKAEVEKLHRRARWARLQLADLLYMAKSGGENPVGIMGSWAGAFGLCQFIPTSYRAYGRDGNGDNVIDLDNVSDDAASIAYYLNENGWHSDISRAKQKTSIKRYNHSEFYADCVLALADGIERQWKGLAAIE